MRFRTLDCSVALIASLVLGSVRLATGTENLLLNADFAYHSFDSSRTGVAGTQQSGAVPCWDADAYGAVEVRRSTRIAEFRTAYPVDGVVKIRPGMKFSQFALLHELGLDHGDHVSLAVRGRQAKAGGLRATIHCLRLDNQSGTFSIPPDTRVFPRHSRGELVRGPSYTAVAPEPGDVFIKLENVEVVGKFTENADQSNDEPNTIGLSVEFANDSDADVWLYAPCLVCGPQALERLPAARPSPEAYRGIPRTMQKLRRGEPLHIIVMGSSIDRGSANPRMALFDEDPQSSTFKQPLAVGDFDGEKIGRPEWNDYIGWWQHHFMYGGRLRQWLMRHFDYPIDKILLNTMAADGSSVGEAHSGLLDYAELRLPPDPGLTGHRRGKTWRELYPAVFERPEGPRPDLVIFGSGANEHIDGADEIAVFEGTIRWFQRRYPDIEFIFCMWQNRDGYTPNPPHLAELALRYQVPQVDLGRALSLATRHCNSYALCPKDGHPQAAGHFLWADQLQRVFDAPGPTQSGIAQRQLPERISPYTIGWEGESTTYDRDHPRLARRRAVVLDETTVNLWAKTKDDLVCVVIDGSPASSSRRRPSAARDLRNSTFAAGRLSLGDRHIVEVTGNEVELIAVDMKRAIDRRWYPVTNPAWTRPPKPAPGSASPKSAVTPFDSAWGAPYGDKQLVLVPGESLELDVPATDLSPAYVDDPAGGVLAVTVDDEERLRVRTDEPFTTADGKKLYLENRRGIRGLPYGMHRVRVTAEGGPVRLLGLYAYDTRSHRDQERVLRGYAAPGETIEFSAPFRARPIVSVGGGLTFHSADLHPDRVTFGGTAAGSYEIIGQ